MRERRLTAILRRIHGSARADAGDGKALEADLLPLYRKLHPKNRRWLVLLNPWNRAARFGLAGLAACVVVVGACTTDVTTGVDVGKSITMDLEPNANVNLHARHFRFFFHFRYRMVLDSARDVVPRVLTAQPGVEDVSVTVDEDSAAGAAEEPRDVNLRILIFGSDLDGAALVNTITDSVPALSEAKVTINDLRTTFSESLASKMGRALFGWQGGRPDPQELRRRALQELAARG